jgi:hypothetical protein
MLNQINNAINLSEITNRTLIIDTNGGAFMNDFNSFFCIPGKIYYTNYEVMDSKIHQKYQEYINSKVIYSNGDYILNGKSIVLDVDDLINSEDDLIIFTYMRGKTGNKWNIKVKKEIIEKIKMLPKIEDNYIGFHFRNTDMKSDFNLLIKEVLKYTNEIKYLYFSTDDSKSISNLIDYVPKDVKIIQYTKPGDYMGKNIHYSNPNKDEIIMNSLIDMYFLKKSKYFINSPTSSFSRRVILMRDDENKSIF